MIQESGSIRLVEITPDFIPPDTLSKDLNRQLQTLESLNPTHIAVVDRDVSLPSGFYGLPEIYPDADIIGVKVVPSSRVFLVWEMIGFWMELKPRVRDCAVIYKARFLAEQGGFPDSETPGTLLQEKARIIAIADLRAVHNQPFSLKHSVKIQLRDGRSRAKMRYSFWKTLLHSLFRLRPLVLYGYIGETIRMEREEVEMMQENVW